MASNKLVAVRISHSLVENFLKSTGDECVFFHIDGVPQDSVMVDLRYNFQEAVYYAAFSHDSFDEVEPGEKLPVVYPEITTYFA